jgi:hypothetical protein
MASLTWCFARRAEAWSTSVETDVGNGRSALEKLLASSYFSEHDAPVSYVGLEQRKYREDPPASGHPSIGGYYVE